MVAYRASTFLDVSYIIESMHFQNSKELLAFAKEHNINLVLSPDELTVDLKKTVGYRWRLFGWEVYHIEATMTPDFVLMPIYWN